MALLEFGVLLLLTIGQGINFFSAKQDIEIGVESAKAADHALSIVRDVNLNRYFRSIGQRVVRSPSLTGFQYRFQIVNSKDVNSLGFPGGAIYIHRGLLEMASSDDELAAILAHEVGHVSARHGTAQLSRQLLVQSPISIAAGLPTMEGWKEQLARLGISLGVDASFLRYSREQEMESSLTAVRLLADARFDPKALLTLLDKINEAHSAENIRLPAFAFNHPQSENVSPQLAEEIERRTSTREGIRHAAATPEFKNFRAILVKMPFPAVEKEGVAATPTADAIANVFTHPQDYYRLGYPAGWLVRPNGPNGAIIAPVDGVQSSRAGDDITHGVMFDLFDIAVPDRSLTLEQATNRLIVFLRQRNQSLKIVPGAQAQTLVSDEPGLRTVMIGKSNATNSAEVIWVVTRVYYQTLFYMVFVAPEDEFALYQPVFEQIIRSARLR